MKRVTCAEDPHGLLLPALSDEQRCAVEKGPANADHLLELFKRRQALDKQETSPVEIALPYVAVTQSHVGVGQVAAFAEFAPGRCAFQKKGMGRLRVSLPELALSQQV